MENKESFKQYISLIGEKFQTEISPAMSAMIWKTLEPFPDDVCEKAFNQVILKGRFYKDLLPDLTELLVGNKKDNAIEAWSKVDHAMRNIGNYASIDFGDNKIHTTIEMLGGWEYLGTLDEEEWKWKRKEFESIYQVIQPDHSKSHVAGFIELSNSKKGREVPKPITLVKRIPNKEKPKEIESHGTDTRTDIYAKDFS